MNWNLIISFLSSLLPFVFRKRTPEELAARELRRSIRFLEKEFRRKDSEGGRRITENERAQLDYKYEQYIKLLTGK